MQTHDLLLAAFLLSRGHSPQISRLPSGTHRFDFSLDAVPDAMAYEDGAAVVATPFAQAVRQIKRRMATHGKSS